MSACREATSIEPHTSHASPYAARILPLPIFSSSSERKAHVPCPLAASGPRCCSVHVDNCKQLRVVCVHRGASVADRARAYTERSSDLFPLRTQTSIELSAVKLETKVAARRSSRLFGVVETQGPSLPYRGRRRRASTWTARSAPQKRLGWSSTFTKKKEKKKTAQETVASMVEIRTHLRHRSRTANIQQSCTICEYPQARTPDAFAGSDLGITQQQGAITDMDQNKCAGFTRAQETVVPNDLPRRSLVSSESSTQPRELRGGANESKR